MYQQEFDEPRYFYSQTQSAEQTYRTHVTAAAPEDPPNIWNWFFGETRSKRKERFLTTVKKGDILISKNSKATGFIGHAAIMATDYWVLEMPGGGATCVISSSSRSISSNQNETLEDNNRRISKEDWYDEHNRVFSSDDITVYRCPDYNIACMAADWAYEHYYNSSGGSTKTIHIRYSLISPLFEVRDPSYCSKLVLQSYYYGTGSAKVISIIGLTMNTTAIVPTTIPSYFKSSYALSIVF